MMLKHSTGYKLVILTGLDKNGMYYSSLYGAINVQQKIIPRETSDAYQKREKGEKNIAIRLKAKQQKACSAG